MVSCPYPVIPPKSERRLGTPVTGYGARSTTSCPVPSFDRSYRHDVDDRKHWARSLAGLVSVQLPTRGARAACCK